MKVKQLDGLGNYAYLPYDFDEKENTCTVGVANEYGSLVELKKVPINERFSWSVNNYGTTFIVYRNFKNMMLKEISGSPEHSYRYKPNYVSEKYCNVIVTDKEDNLIVKLTNVPINKYFTWRFNTNNEFHYSTIIVTTNRIYKVTWDNGQEELVSKVRFSTHSGKPFKKVETFESYTKFINKEGILMA